MTVSLDDILLSAKNDNHSVKYIADVSQYFQVLQDQGLPGIFSLKHLCLLADIDYKLIFSICKTDRLEYYKRFKLQKRSGGVRIIHTPKEPLKYLQKWILQNIISKIPSHESCKGFDKSTCIKQNAEVHLKKEAILKIDLLKFYDSINEKRIFGVFKDIGFHPNLSVSLAKICTLVPDEFFLESFTAKEQQLKNIISTHGLGILPQGGPTSPKISNLITRKLDARLSGLALSNGLCYSRYADDMTFSGNKDTLEKIIKVAYRIIKEESFVINYDKTKVLKRGSQFFVTGLSVNNDLVTVPRKRKKEIENHLYFCTKYGVLSHLEKCKIKNHNFKDWLLGNITFVYSIEKEIGDSYFKKFNEIIWPV